VVQADDHGAGGTVTRPGEIGARVDGRTAKPTLPPRPQLTFSTHGSRRSARTRFVQDVLPVPVPPNMFSGHALCGVERPLQVGALSVVRNNLPRTDLAEEFTETRQDIRQGLARFLVHGKSLLARPAGDR
jgi:hypothetical protein